MDDITCNLIQHQGRTYRWRFESSLYVVLDTDPSENQRLVCVAWPDDDEQYADREAFLSAISDMMTEEFVAEAISIAATHGWTPYQHGRDFVIKYDEGRFTVLGEEPI